MPRLKKRIYATSSQEEIIAERLRAKYKAQLLSIPQIQKELGVSYDTAKKWLKDLDFYQICGSKKYDVNDVARHLAGAIRLGG